jgi:hypothetical protein
MELKITEMFNNYSEYRDNPHNYQNSIANSGLKNIAQVTWNNAKENNQGYLFVTDENRDEFISYYRGFGAWDDLDEWDNNRLNALTIQEVTAEILEFERCDGWEDYEEEAEKGQVSGRLFPHEKDVYIYIGE